MIEKQELDENALKMMKLKLIGIERENAKTKEIDDKTIIDYEELEEKVENAENERINKILSNHGCTVIAQSDCHTDFLIKSGEN